MNVFHHGACVLLCVLLSACVSVKWGTPILTSGLDGLKLGESTRADVLLALGQPRGEGGAVVSYEPRPREIVFYEYMTGDSKRIELEILLVFLAGGLYDGHLWFASTEKITQQGGIPVFKAPDKTEIGRFPGTTPLEANFQRGRTSRDQVIQALGPPVGTGAAVLPPHHRQSEVLYYEDIQVANLERVGDEYVVDVQQRIMLVMIADGVFDGFMWFSSTAKPRVKVQ